MMCDPSGGGADPTDPSGGDDNSETTEVTITMKGDGTYMVYPGPAPDDSGSSDDDTSEDDDDAMGAAGDQPAGGGPAGGASMGAGMMGGGAAQGQPAQSIGEALKLAMDILNSSAQSAGAPGSADDQLNAGFTASKSPTPATGMAQKY